MDIESTLHNTETKASGTHADTLPHWMVVAANALSTAFSPLLVPTYCMAIVMWVTPLAILPEKIRFLSTLVVMAITAGLPFAAIITLIRLRVVSDLAISDRRQRALPLSIAILCYLGATAYLACIHAPIWLVLMIAGAAVSCLLTVLISLKWKISAHANGIGGLVGMLLWLIYHHLGTFNLLPWLLVAVIIAGLVGSSRLILRHHTQGQIYAGFLLGMVSIYATMSLTIVYYLFMK